MRNIYGTRSIIPNNYYFTFDKIYEEESQLNNGDGVLIGRCVLAKDTHTVHLKTVSGYIRVAKLDNEGRFKYSEGYILDKTFNINNVTNDYTFNGNGVYVVPFDEVSKYPVYNNTNEPSDWYSYPWALTHNYQVALEDITDIKDENTKKETKQTQSGIWPHIRGIDDKTYLTGRVFLLQQYSQNIIPDINENVSEKNFNEYFSEYTQENPSAFDSITLYQKIEQNDNTVIPVAVTFTDIETLKSHNEPLYFLSQFTWDITQMMTDWGNKDNSDQKNGEIKHGNKVFKRIIKTIFSKETKIDKEGYTLDTQNCYDYTASGMMLTNYSTSLSDNLYYRYYKIEEWEDVSEQYTGYIGDLDPYTDGNNLVLPQDENSYIHANNASDKNSWIPYNKYTVYYIGENEDKIEATDEEVDETKYNCCEKKYYIKTNSSRQNLTDATDLVDAIQKHDKILGSATRINNTTGIKTVNSVSAGTLSDNLINDARPYKILADNIMDAIVHHAADIGQIENLKNSNYKIDGLAEPNKDAEQTTHNSVFDIVKILDSIIGNYDNVINQKDGEDSFGENASSNERPYTIHTNTIMEALKEIYQDVGFIDSLRLTNAQDFINNSDITPDKEIGQFNSLIDIIYILDSIIGDYKNSISYTVYDNEKNIVSETDRRPYNIDGNDIMSALKYIAANIGMLDDLNNASYLSSEDIENPDKDTGKYNSVMDIIKILDSIIGTYKNLTKIEDAGADDIVSILNNHTARISTNENNITKNRDDIETNKNNIETNATNIETNATNITKNENNITKNRKDIETNKSNITKNRDDIDSNITNISTIQQNIGNINDLKISSNNQRTLVNAINEAKVHNDSYTTAIETIASNVDILTDRINSIVNDNGLTWEKF